MIGIFLRELRENFKWALIICAALLVVIIHELRDPEPMLLFQIARNYTPWIAPIAGLLLGIAQLLFEVKPDNWSFVVHRPVRRGQIFAAKVAAGLLLLYGALIVPCIIATIWAARPGNLATPFQGRMVLPMVADVLSGGCFYFAGMVLTLRRARWLGSRLLPVGLALSCSAMVNMFIAQFWLSIVIILIVQTIGAVAAWGVFSSNGADNGPWPVRLALGTMIYPGAVGLGLVLLGFSQAFAPGDGRWQYYQVDRHGDVVVVTQTTEHGQRGWSFTDPSGLPLPQYEGMDLDDPANREQFMRFSTRLVDPRGIPWPLDVLYTGTGYRVPTPGLAPVRGPAQRGARVRFAAIYDVPRQIIELYDPVTRIQIGTIGPDGFSPAPNPSGRPFPGTPLNLFSQRGPVLAFDTTVYWLELNQRRVRPVYSAEPNDPVFSAGEMGQDANLRILVATRAGLHLLHADGKPLYSVPWEQDPASSNFDAAVLPANQHLLLRAFSNPGVTPQRTRMFEYSEDGKLLRTTDLPILHSLGKSKEVETAVFASVFPSVLRWICPAWILDDVIDLRMGEFSTLFGGVLLVNAVLCVAVSLLIGRRCGLGGWRTIGWSALNLLLGPAGVVVMLALNPWPGREVCAQCGARRYVGRRDCPSCGAAPAPVSRDGREVFEPFDAFPLENILQPVG